jgi:hypothetical protein
MPSRYLTYCASMLLVCAACQSQLPGPSRPVMPTTAFMTMWNTYQRCLSRHDLGEMMSDVDHLSVWAGETAAPPSLGLRRMHPRVYAPPVRTAADPKAMLADCTLRAAHLAKGQRLLAIAEDLYKRVTEGLSHERYAYYVGEAKAGLHDVRQAQISAP